MNVKSFLIKLCLLQLGICYNSIVQADGVTYRKINFSMSCENGKTRRPEFLPEVPGYSINPRKDICVDRDREVKGIVPVGARLIQDKKDGFYVLDLKLSESDALNLSKLTSHSNGSGNIIISIESGYIVSSVVMQAFHGSVYSISSDSQENLFKMTKLFILKKDE